MLIVIGESEQERPLNMSVNSWRLAVLGLYKELAVDLVF